MPLYINHMKVLFNRIFVTGFYEIDNKTYYFSKVGNLLKGKFYIIPGWDVKLAIFFSHFVPSSFISKITNNIDIGFCSIDIVKSDTSFLVMEINSGVMMKYLISEKDSGYSIAKDIYTEAILSMFDVK